MQGGSSLQAKNMRHLRDIKDYNTVTQTANECCGDTFACGTTSLLVHSLLSIRILIIQGQKITHHMLLIAFAPHEHLRVPRAHLAQLK